MPLVALAPTVAVFKKVQSATFEYKIVEYCKKEPVVCRVKVKVDEYKLFGEL